MRFEEYIHFDAKKSALHPLPKTPRQFKHFENLILYGPSGAGKYTLALRILAEYSKSRLKYEKRVIVSTSTGGEVPVKVSDVHYEVDAELLGCNARTDFYEVFVHIQEMIGAKFPNKDGVVLCTNFHLVHAELLDIFYSFMQSGVKFVLLTEAVSFLPPSLTRRCRTIAVPKPAAPKVCGAFKTKLPKDARWSNLKDLTVFHSNKAATAESFADTLARHALSPSVRISDLREDLYNVTVHNQNMDDVFWQLFRKLSSKIKSDKLPTLFAQIVYCMQCRSCNYRPIFHLEYLVCSFMLSMERTA
jgi:hypothetical protein